ncbi:MAG: membrane protein insertion efficiency factor YidD [Acidobacteriales bacterium]|nr:membrane protein insertion efficiency factor YidD [Terriglobales bacterium]
MNRIPSRVAVFVLKGYKQLLSPLLPNACRFVPTCSEYAIEAVERYGIVRGSGKALWRLMRCHPFAHSGFDPVVPHPSACPGHAAVVKTFSVQP